MLHLIFVNLRSQVYFFLFNDVRISNKLYFEELRNKNESYSADCYNNVIHCNLQILLSMNKSRVK